jgi:hypothetical protein
MRNENKIIIATDLVHRVYIVHTIYLKSKKKKIHGIIDNLLHSVPALGENKWDICPGPRAC